MSGCRRKKGRLVRGHQHVVAAFFLYALKVATTTDVVLFFLVVSLLLS